MMENYYQNKNQLKESPRFNDAYIPDWAKTLI